MEQLKGLCQLEKLLIGKSKITEAGQKALQEANPGLRFDEDSTSLPISTDLAPDLDRPRPIRLLT